MMCSHFAYLSSLSGSQPCPEITVAGIENADNVTVSNGDGTDDYGYGSKVSVIFTWAQILKDKSI